MCKEDDQGAEPDSFSVFLFLLVVCFLSVPVHKFMLIYLSAVLYIAFALRRKDKIIGVEGKRKQRAVALYISVMHQIFFQQIHSTDTTTWSNPAAAVSNKKQRNKEMHSL